MGYISEDESFDAEYYEQQKRRRYSISWLMENGFVDLEDENYIKAVKKQETILAINYQDKPEPNRSRRIQWSILWAKLTFAITFAIKRKVHWDKDIRRNTLLDRVNVMNNHPLSDEGDDGSVNNRFGVKDNNLSDIDISKNIDSQFGSGKKFHVGANKHQVNVVHQGTNFLADSIDGQTPSKSFF
jgi:hypothetical protein